MKYAACIILFITLSGRACSMGTVTAGSDSTANGVDSTFRSANSDITIHSSTDSTRVYIDSQYIGTTPLDTVRIVEGMHILRYVHPQGKLWVNGVIAETLLVHPREHLTRTAIFPEYVFITSQPYGATVRADNTVLGETPLYLPSSRTITFVTLSKAGFQETTVPAGKSVNVQLQPQAGNAVAFGPASPFLSTNTTKTSLPIYLTTAATVVSGAAAAYFKIKADNAYGDYRQTGDEAIIDRVHQNDTIAGIALVACEVNLIALTYFLFSR